MKMITCPLCNGKFRSPQSYVAAKAGSTKSAARAAASKANGGKPCAPGKRRGRPPKLAPPPPA